MTTFVLVHGGWHGGWCWRRVAPLLESAGHEVHCPTLTGLGDRAHLARPDTGLADHVADVVAVLELDDLRDVVLVGHSSGGAVVTGVAQRCPDRLRELVYLDAFVPAPGRSVFDLLPAARRDHFLGLVDESGRIVLDRDAAMDGWGLPAADREWVRPRLRPFPVGALRDPLPPDPVPGLPRRYVHCTVKPGGDSFAGFAAAADSDPTWRLDTLDTGHDAMITAPRALATLLAGVVSAGSAKPPRRHQSRYRRNVTSHTVPSPFTETTGPARHAAFAELATTGPVQKVVLFTGVPAWVVTGYAEARELLAHPALVKTVGGPHMDAMPLGLSAAMNTHLLGMNPPDHTRLRRLVAAAFTVRRVEALAPRVQEIADALLDDMAVAGADGRPVDLVDGFGFPLPITVITELLGIPPGDRADFRRWSTIVVNGSVHPAEVYVDAARNMVGYVRELIAAKRADPADDLLSALIAVHEGDDRLSQDELTSMVGLLLVAGYETTANLIVSGTYALLSHPDQLALLRAEPERLPAAVEELLRYDGPVQVTIPAIAAAPIEVGGVTIPAGDVVLPALLAANRDPARFPEPDRLDVTRASNTHMAFGHGLHHCLGAPLARLEGRIALGALLARFPGLRLADPAAEPARDPGLLINGLVALPVVLG